MLIEWLEFAKKFMDSGERIEYFCLCSHSEKYFLLAETSEMVGTG